MDFQKVWISNKLWHWEFTGVFFVMILGKAR